MTVSSFPARKAHPGWIAFLLRSAVVVSLILRFGFSGLVSSARGDDGNSFFEKNIRPLLIERCDECHSKQSKKPKGGLRLDHKDGWLKGGDRGPAIEPGKPQSSLLIQAIRYEDEELKMPPKGKLSERRWVGKGGVGKGDSHQIDKTGISW